MAIDETHWKVTRASGEIDYIGGDHGTTTASYITVIELHRWLQDLADDATASGDDQLDITDILPSSRATDNYITLIGGYYITATAAEHLYDGTVVNTDGTIYDGIVNYGNIGIAIQIHQDGAVLADDFWNYNVGGADDTSTNNATVMTDSGESWTVDAFIGYVIWNTTDDSKGLITSNTSNTVTVGELTGGTTNNWNSGDAFLISQGLNSNNTSGISHQFLVKTSNAGTDIDNLKLLGTNRTYLKTFGEFLINATARGNNVLALADALDLNNTTAESTVAGWTDVYMDRTDSTTTVSGVNATGQAILNVVSGAVFTAGDHIMTGVATDSTMYQIASIATNALTLSQNLQIATVGGETAYDSNFGFTQIDVNNNATDEDYYTHWDRGGKTINQFTEYQKYITRDGASLLQFGIDPELFRGISHEVDADARSGTFAPVEDISWTAGDTGSIGTGQMLAIDSPGAGTKMWFQLLTGGVPSDNSVITGGISGATFTMSADPTDRSSLIQTPYAGVSTGSAIIGSYGFSLQTTDLASTDLVFDLTNTKVTPPNNVTFSVNGGEVGEDYLYVAEWDGSSADASGDPEVNYNQLALNTALTADNATAVVIGHGNGDSATLPPITVDATTFVRVEDNDGYWRKLHISGVTNTTELAIDTSDGNEDFGTVNADAGNSVHITYLDVLTTSDPQEFTYVYDSDRKFVVKGRDGGGTPIKESIGTGTMTNTGGSANITRTTDV